jgi:predicted regulator of Ras-like GTPase activity (Roadblock/LC7/MglB family)
MSNNDTLPYKQALDEFLADFEQVAGAVLSTQDGLLVESSVRTREIEADAVAAMSASILSLADALAGQTGRPLSDSLISQAESSTLVMLHAGQMILTVVGKNDVNTGMVLSAARRTAKNIQTLALEMGDVKGTESISDPASLMKKEKNEILELRVVGGN